jgi:biopolymer transport protein ExbD
MTSLIDVIFLLLLFFMLTSTFSKFSEVELASSGAGTVTPSNTPPLFLQLGPDMVRLNGDPVALDRLAQSALGDADKGTVVLVALGDGVDAQRLTDLLVALRGLAGLRVSVLGV